MANRSATVLRFPARRLESALAPGATRLDVLAALEAGWPVPDRTFDEIFPAPYHRASDIHWTPVAIARRAAELLEVGRGDSVLDVGSGVGKFCLVGALTTRARFVGVEQREHLVEVARDVARRHHVLRAEFVCGDMAALDWRSFAGIYLYNPFFEHISPWAPIDRTIHFAACHYERACFSARHKLRTAPAGTRVVTYHGFGADLPAGYLCLHREPAGTDELALWRRE